ncbi:alpha/beta fold hydrolase, partial [Pradoshia sp.]
MISQFVSINNKKMEIVDLGNKGTPIVILTGMGCSFYEWYEVTKYLAISNRVIMFHRPGLGLSEIGSEERNTRAVVNELNTLLKELKIREPILLVGHSYGGLCVQHYAKVFPENVAGMVLVDSTSVDLKELDDLELPVIDEGESEEAWLNKCYSYSLMKQEELKELVNPSLTDKPKGLPLDVQQHLMNFQVSPSLYKAMYQEISNWKMDADVIRNLEDVFDIPL